MSANAPMVDLLGIIETDLAFLREALRLSEDEAILPGGEEIAADYLECVKLLPLAAKDGIASDEDGIEEWVLRLDRIDAALSPRLRAVLDDQLTRSDEPHRDLVEAVTATERAFARFWSDALKRLRQQDGPPTIREHEVLRRREEMFASVIRCFPGKTLSRATVRNAADVVSQRAFDGLHDAEQLVSLGRTRLMPTLAAWREQEIGSVRNAMTFVIFSALNGLEDDERSRWLEDHWDLVEAVVRPGQSADAWEVEASGLLAMVGAETSMQRRAAAGPRLTELLRAWTDDEHGKNGNAGWAVFQALSFARLLAPERSSEAVGIVAAVRDLPRAAAATSVQWLSQFLTRDLELGPDGPIPRVLVSPLIELALARVQDEQAPEQPLAPSDALSEVIETLAYHAAAAGKASDCWRIIDALTGADPERWSAALARAASVALSTADLPGGVDRIARIVDDLADRPLTTPRDALAFVDLVVSLAARLRGSDPDRADEVISKLERTDVNREARVTLDEALGRELTRRWRQEQTVDGALALVERIEVLRARSETNGEALFEIAAYLLEHLPRNHRRRQEIERLHAAVTAELRRRPGILLHDRDPDLEAAVPEHTVDERLDLISAHPHKEWPLPPLFPGEWDAKELAGVRELLRAVLAVPQFHESAELDQPILLRAARAPFYRQAHVVELGFRTEDGSIGSQCFLVGERHLANLNGTSPPLHEFNAAYAPDLTSVDSAEAYLRFFCTVVCGEHGSFRIIDTLEDLTFREALADARREAVGRLLKPFQLNLTDEGAEAEATIHYSTALFNAELQVARNGMVEMTNDTVLEANLPVKVQGFWNGTRRLRTLPQES